jgi:hypothetical protein
LKVKTSTVNGKGTTPVKPTSSKKPADKGASAVGSNEKAQDPVSQHVEPPVEVESVLPRTPSPSTRHANHDDDQDAIETVAKPESDAVEGGHPETSASDDISAPPHAERSAIIGRVGLAGAREAPTPSELGSTARETVKTASENDHGNEGGDKLNGNKIEGAHDLESPVDIIHEQSNTTVEEPEMPRSAPSPFGRIGHAGGQAGKHELEKPNPDAILAGGETRNGRKEVEWNEEELKRDPAKTIVSPNTHFKEAK